MTALIDDFRCPAALSFPFKFKLLLLLLSFSPHYFCYHFSPPLRSIAESWWKGWNAEKAPDQLVATCSKLIFWELRFPTGTMVVLWSSHSGHQLMLFIAVARRLKIPVHVISSGDFISLIRRRIGLLVNSLANWYLSDNLSNEDANRKTGAYANLLATRESLALPVLDT